MLGFLLVGFNRKLVKWKRPQRLETHLETIGDGRAGQSLYSEGGRVMQVPGNLR